MKRFVGPVSLIAVLAAAVVYVGTATGSSVNFSASYKGKVTEVKNGSMVTATPKGVGKATLIGKGSMTGKVTGDSNSSTGCSTISGTGSLKGTKGTLALKLLSGSRVCAASQDDQSHLTFQGKAKVTGGTGALKKASGTLNFLGHYNRGTGAFDVKLVGTLKH